MSASDAPHALDLDAVPAPDLGQALGRGDAVAFAAVVEQQEVPLIGKEHATAVGLHGRLELRRRRGLVADSRQSCHQQQSGYDPGALHRTDYIIYRSSCCPHPPGRWRFLVGSAILMTQFQKKSLGSGRV